MRRLLGTLLLGIAGCGGGPPLLSLSAVPAAGASLELRPVLEGKVGAAVNTPLGALPQRKRTLRLELREPLRGAPLFAQVFDSAGCLVAWGQAAADQPLVLSAVTDCPNQGQRGPVLRSVSAALLPAERPTELTLRGAGLLPGVVIMGDGQPLPHTWVSPLEVRVTAPAAPGGLGRTLLLSALLEQQEAILAPSPRYYEATIKLGAPKLVNGDPKADAWTSQVVIGDTDRDGLPELLYGRAAQFHELRNQTARGESALRFSSLLFKGGSVNGSGPQLLATGSDGVVDLVYVRVVDASKSALFLRRGLQRPTLSTSFSDTEELIYSTPVDPMTKNPYIQALATDVDGDHRTDLVLYTFDEVIPRGAGQLFVLRNSGVQGALQRVQPASACAPFTTISGYVHLDDDGRGAPLFFTTSDPPGGTVSFVFRFPQLGLCPERTDLRSGNYLPDFPVGTLGGVGLPRVITTAPQSLLVDLNGDGLADMLSSTTYVAPPLLSLWINRGDASAPRFNKEPDQVLTLAYDTPPIPNEAQVRVADLNGDGRLDVVVGMDNSGGNAALFALLNQPAP